LTEIFPSKLQKLIFLRTYCRDHVRKDTQMTVERKYMDKRETHMGGKMDGEIGQKMTHLTGKING